MKIAIDAMGGDYAPREIVLGAVDAVKEEKLGVVLVGNENEIKSILKEISTSTRMHPRKPIQQSQLRLLRFVRSMLKKACSISSLLCSSLRWLLHLFHRLQVWAATMP